MAERNTTDFGSLNESHPVQIAKMRADDILANLALELGHPLAVDSTAPVRDTQTGVESYPVVSDPDFEGDEDHPSEVTK